MSPEDRQKRILIALNKCDKSNDPDARMNYDKELPEPNDVLKEENENRKKEFRERIKDEIDIDTNIVCYSAGFYNERKKKDYPPYNIDELFEYICKDLPKRKVLALNLNANERVYEGESGSKNKSSFWNSFVEVVDAIAESILPRHIYTPLKKIGSAIFSIFD